MEQFGVERDWVWEKVAGQGVRAEDFGPVDRFAVEEWRLAFRMERRSKKLSDAYVEQMLRFAEAPTLGAVQVGPEAFVQSLVAGFPNKGTASPFAALTEPEWVEEMDLRTVRRSRLRFWVPGNSCHHVAAFAHLLVPELEVVRLESAKHSLLMTDCGLIDLCFQAAGWSPQDAIELLGDIEYIGWVDPAA